MKIITCRRAAAAVAVGSLAVAAFTAGRGPVFNVSAEPVAQSTKKVNENRATRVSQAELRRIIGAAHATQQGALADERVTYGEYRSALNATVKCVLTSFPDAKVTGPKLKANKLFLDFVVTVGAQGDSGAEGLLSGEIKRCTFENSNAIDNVFRYQQIPTGSAREAAEARITSCLRAKGVATHSSFETTVEEGMAKLGVVSAGDCLAGEEELFVRPRQ